jgi:hypothetical protein
MIAECGQNRAAEFYSVYSVFVLFEATLVFSVVRRGQNASPWSQLFFIFKCVPTSQAGRRGFEPHLPLHLFNDLQVYRRSQFGRKRSKSE